MLTFTRARRSLPLCIAIGLGAGCLSEDPEPNPYVEPTVAPGQAGAPFQIEGTWAYKQVLWQYVKQAYGNKYDHQSIIAYAIGTMTTVSPTTASWSDLICIVEMSETSGAIPTLAPSYYENPPTPPIEVQFSEAVIGASVTSPQQIEIYGAFMEDDPMGTLPTSPDDSRLDDFDHDGNPGFTIYIDGAIDGWLWAVQRYIYEMEGTVVDQDTISGPIQGYTENSYLESSGELIPTTSEIKPDNEGNNYYELVRVADDYPCEQLLAEKDSIFSI